MINFNKVLPIKKPRTNFNKLLPIKKTRVYHAPEVRLMH